MYHWEYEIKLKNASVTGRIMEITSAIYLGLRFETELNRNLLYNFRLCFKSYEIYDAVFLQINAIVILFILSAVRICIEWDFSWFRCFFSCMSKFSVDIIVWQVKNPRNLFEWPEQSGRSLIIFVLFYFACKKLSNLHTQIHFYRWDVYFFSSN